MFAGFKNRTAAKAAEWFGYNANQQVNIGISNLAKVRIPNTYGTFSIEKITFIPPLLPNNRYVIGVVTVGDRMTITMQYNCKKDSETVRTMFKDAIAILRSKE